jgi:hypothetical protein
MGRPRRCGVSRKKLVAVTAVAILMIVAAAVYLRIPPGTGKNSSTSSEISNSTSVGSPGIVLISLGQTPRLLGPGITMNYTMTLAPGLGVAGRASLKSDSPAGIMVNISPSNITFTGVNLAVDVSVRASGSISSGEYNIGFGAIWGTGSSNLVFRFTVVRNLVLLIGGGFEPLNLSIRVGESVLWLNVNPGGDEFNGLLQVQIVEVNATSPSLTLYSTWSYRFNQAGTYHISDPLLSSLKAPEGLIVVG